MGSGELWQRVPSHDAHEESLKVSVERVAGKLTVNIGFCFDAADPVPVERIIVEEAFGQSRAWRIGTESRARHLCKKAATRQRNPYRVAAGRGAGGGGGAAGAGG